MAASASPSRAPGKAAPAAPAAAGASSARLDEYLAQLTQLSKNKVRTLLNDGHVIVNNKNIRDRLHELNEGDILQVFNADAGSTFRFVFPSLDAGDWPMPAPVAGRRLSSTSSDDESTGTKKKRFRPAHEVLNQLQWDATYNTRTVVIGYEDRFTGIQEVTKDTWDQGLDDGLGSIPMHRIRYFKLDGEVMWDRTTRVDNLRAAERE